MTRRVIVTLPDEIADLGPELQQFVQNMVDKLAQNSHKKTPRTEKPDRFLTLMFKEVLEAHQQYIEDPLSPNMPLELSDIANYAFLMGVAINHKYPRSVFDDMKAGQ